jgi:peptide chain release factor subunit 1
MEKTTTTLATPLRDVLERLASFEPSTHPVLSLYLDLRVDQQGRRHHDLFLRKALDERARALTGESLHSFSVDAERIRQYVADLPPSVQGVAIFACSAGALFEAVQLEGGIDGHWLFVASVPHLYPLVRVTDQYPRFAALLVDTNSARVFVFSLGTIETETKVVNVKTRRTSMGGWSQARYQRHVENFHLHHMKEVIAVLDHVVREEAISGIVVSCDEVARPLLTDLLPKHLATKVVDTVRLDIHASGKQVLEEALHALRQQDVDTDAARVEALLDAWRAGGLGVVGPDDTLQALELRQVEELLITATPDALRRASASPVDDAPGPVDVTTTAAAGQDSDQVKLANSLVARAHRNDARIRFIEDPALLADVGGVGAILRFKL